MPEPSANTIIPAALINRKIYFLRKTRVMLDSDLARLYHEDLRRKIAEMEKRYDSKFHAVFATLRQMLETPIPPKRQIGFHTQSKPA
jgi:hypothetical protein